MENTYCVYMHTNKINGKRYVGQTKVKPEERWGSKGCRYSKSTYFFNAIKKYGWDNFVHDILYTDLTHEAANKIEKELIEFYNTRDSNYGYNIREGGSNGGHDERTKKIMSQIRKEKYSGENHPRYGTHLSEETKKKISEAEKGEKNWMYGKKMPSETREKISKANKGKKRTQEFRKMMSEMKKGKGIGENNPNFGNHKLAGANNPRARKVLQYDLQGNLIKEWEFAKQASIELGLGYVNIIKCLRGTQGQKTAWGFIWKYKE